MMTKSGNYRTTVVCMVHNADQYLSEFLLYHLRLVDHIYLIDHRSRYDLRHLNRPDVTVVRSNQVAQFQSECTNLVLDHFEIRENYDWLFVLDVDEFLPFKERSEFHSFLKSKASHKVIRLYWRNGVPFDAPKGDSSASLIDCNSLRFFRDLSVSIKSFANIQKMKGNFVVPTGAHHIAYRELPWFSKLPRVGGSIYRSHDTGKPLFHVVAFDMDTFAKKIRHYVKQMDYRAHVKGQGGWAVRDYPTQMSEHEWLQLIANFRVTDSSLHVPANRTDFVDYPLLDHLDPRAVRSLRERIQNLPGIGLPSQSKEEQAYLAQKVYDTDIVQNVAWFAINQNLEIVNQIPS